MMDRVLSRLENVKTNGRGQCSARCPCHDDKHNSLAISKNEAGDILLHCHAGCHVDDIVNSLGLTMSDLFATKAEMPAANNAVQIEYLYANGKLKKKRFYKSDGSKGFAWEHLENGKWVNVIAEGRLVNIAAADGHPAEIMDLSFAVQALSAKYIMENRGKLGNKVIDVSGEMDDLIARRKLAAWGVEIDTLTEEQEIYLNSWQF